MDDDDDDEMMWLPGTIGYWGGPARQDRPSSSIQGARGACTYVVLLMTGTPPHTPQTN
jgi:hypothetical protein